MPRPAAITVLSDNHAAAWPFKAEQGLSLLVETEGANILFDTGASSLFSENANAMKLELFGIDSIVLSHGHFDHGNGLHKALSSAQNAHLVLSSAALAPKMLQDHSGRMLNIGLSEESVRTVRGAVEAERATFINGPVQLGPNIIVFPSGPRNSVNERWPYFTQQPDGSFEPDLFPDELAMLALGEKSAALILGDSHCGIVRAYKHASELAGERPITLIAGGCDLEFADVADLQALANFLLKTEADICLGHDIGLNGYSTLRRLIGSKVIPMNVGMHLELNR